MAKWQVLVNESAIDDLKALGRKQGRAVLNTAVAQLERDPLAETHRLKTLRSNPIAQREMRLFGRYRVLFTVDRDNAVVRIVLVGEKRGNSLIVRGGRFTTHHESRSAK